MSETVTLPPIDGTQRPSDLQHSGSQALNLANVISFCFPTRTLEGDSPLGRLEVLARFGPLDAQGNLRSGRCGDHVLTAGEVKQMAYDLHARRWQKKLKRDFVDDLVLCTLGIDPKSRNCAYGPKDVQALLSEMVKGDDPSGFEKSTFEFAHFQQTVLTYVKSRFRKAFNAVNYGRPLAARMDNPVKEAEERRALKIISGKETPDEVLKQMTCVLLSNVVSPGRNRIDMKSTLLALGSEVESGSAGPDSSRVSPRPPPDSPQNRERLLRSMRKKELKAKKEPILCGSKQLTASITRRVSFSKEATAAVK